MWEKNYAKWRWGEEEMERQCWASNVNLHNFFKIQLFLGKKNSLDLKNTNVSSLKQKDGMNCKGDCS